jgi:hypothetical protein
MTLLRRHEFQPIKSRISTSWTVEPASKFKGSLTPAGIMDPMSGSMKFGAPTHRPRYGQCDRSTVFSVSAGDYFAVHD